MMMLACILDLVPVLALCGGPALSLSPSLDCQLANQYVEAAIARKVSSLKGVEYRQFRHYDALSDLDGDGHNDLIVLFNAEPASGENDHNDFMAVFLSSDPAGAEPLIVRTGGRGERDPIAIAVRGRRITLDTQEYLPKDPMCCPSGRGTLVFELVGHSLKPIRSAKKGRLTIRFSRLAALASEFVMAPKLRNSPPLRTIGNKRVSCCPVLGPVAVCQGELSL
jgi:hypothetical protein